ncbi:MAG: hypothetical protein OXB93_07265, partial [Cytophagales bacterium]|nr:hypothetical protein [Cytophagales bacterium]
MSLLWKCFLILFATNLCAQDPSFSDSGDFPSSPKNRKARYAAILSDKKDHPFALSEPEKFLSARALKRRSKEGKEIEERDLPVHPDYLRQISSLEGVEVFLTSRWMNAILFEAQADVSDLVEEFSFVLSVEYVGPTEIEKIPQERVEISESDYTFPLRGPSLNYLQESMLGLAEMKSSGYVGEGVWLAIFDSGFPGVDKLSAFRHIFDEERILMTYDFVNRQVDVFHGLINIGGGHGTEVLSCIVASLPPYYVGGSYGVHVALFITANVVGEDRKSL